MDNPANELNKDEVAAEQRQDSYYDDSLSGSEQYRHVTYEYDSSEN